MQRTPTKRQVIAPGAEDYYPRMRDFVYGAEFQRGMFQPWQDRPVHEFPLGSALNITFIITTTTT